MILAFLAPPKTLAKFSEWSDFIFTVFARSGVTGTWASRKFGRLRVNPAVTLNKNDQIGY